MIDKYVLDGKIPRKLDENDPEWKRLFEEGMRQIALDNFQDDDIQVSTIFLGIDHRFFSEGPPILFQTMILGGRHDQYQVRCSTWDEAMKQHGLAVQMVMEEAVVGIIA